MWEWIKKQKMLRLETYDMKAMSYYFESKIT